MGEGGERDSRYRSGGGDKRRRECARVNPRPEVVPVIKILRGGGEVG